jgi:predicted ATPase
VEGGVEEQRQRLLATLADWAIGTARAQPMVIAFEDLHWSDPSSLELQKVLVEQTAPAPIMLIYTARPEFRASWPMRAHHAQITLNRLSKRQVKEMVASLGTRRACRQHSGDARRAYGRCTIVHRRIDAAGHRKRQSKHCTSNP